jgi:hypothetical protein
VSERTRCNREVSLCCETEALTCSGGSRFCTSVEACCCDGHPGFGSNAVLVLVVLSLLIALGVSLVSRAFHFFPGLILEKRDKDLGDGVLVAVDGALDEADREGEFENLGKRALGGDANDEERLTCGSDVAPI